MADRVFPSHVAGIDEKFVDLGDGTHARAVAIAGLDGDVEITGDANIDTSALEALLDGLDDGPEADPEAGSATMLALLRGILAELKAQTALLTTLAGG